MRALARHDGLGVELDTVNRKYLVTKRHHRPVILGLCGQLEIWRQPGPLHHERVIARDGEGTGNARKYAEAVVFNRGRLAVHWHGRSHDRPAERHADRLMAK